MNLNELSDEALSRFIAEKLEPILPPEPKLDSEYISPLGCYRWTFDAPLQPWHWQPRDFVNDFAMTVRLMETARLDVWSNGDEWLAGQAWMNGTVRMLTNSARTDRLGRSAAESFAKVNGMERG